MSKVLVSYFSFTGKTKQLAEAAAEGARGAGAEVMVKEAAATTIQDLIGMDALVVATPQTFGTMAGETKKLFERLWLGRTQIAPKLLFGVIICHANEPAATLDLMDKFATYFGFTKVGSSLTVNVAQLEAGKEPSRQLGAALARASQSA
jgi:multimeric flavodoxin WrbA